MGPTQHSEVRGDWRLASMMHRIRGGVMFSDQHSQNIANMQMMTNSPFGRSLQFERKGLFCVSI